MKYHVQPIAMRVYNETEIAEILKRAASISHENEVEEERGLTLGELEQIAKETGIDSAAINKAAEALELKATPVEWTFWGGPFSFSEQVRVDHEITPAEWENRLIQIREFFQSKGEVNTREAVFEWTSPWDSTNSAHVTALNEGGQSRISVNWKGPLTALPYYLPVPVVAIASLFFASGFLELGSVPGMSFVAISTLAAFTVGRWALRTQMEKAFAKMSSFTASLKGPQSSQRNAHGALEASGHLNDTSDPLTSERESNVATQNEALLHLDREAPAPDTSQPIPGRQTRA